MTSKRRAEGDQESSQRSKTQAVENTSYDSDVPPSPMSEKRNADKLLWRQDPEENFSDWTLLISYETTDENENTTTLHKGALAVGPQKSECFVRIFKAGGRFAESSSNTSRINLTELEANAFPHLLDYLCSVDADLEISTETATALHNLGGHFEARRLRWDSNEFWMTDVNAKNCGTHYEHAKILNDQKVLVAATENWSRFAALACC
jgi:hypothetical protein